MRRSFAWFIDGLVEAATAVDDRLRRRAPLRLVEVSDGYAIEQNGVRRPGAVRLEDIDGTSRFAPAESTAIVKDHDVDLVLPTGELLVRTLDPLPPDSGSYLDGIVRHQLERLVPWRSNDVLYSYQNAPAGPRDERLVVTVFATARSLHAPLISALAALGPRKLRLVYRDVPQANGDVAIGIGNDGAETSRLERFRMSIAAVVAALLVLSALGFGYIGYSWQQASAMLADTDQSIAGLRKQLAAREPKGSIAERDRAAILARKQATPVSVLAIDALANALPDDTWLTEMRIADGHVRISGVSRNVAELVPLIEKSPIFAEPTFYAPTTRLPDGQGDRFFLDARIKTTRESVR